VPAGTPVLLTSGYSDVVQTVASAVRVLRKPFQLAALHKSMREALEHAQKPDTDDRVLPFPAKRQRDRCAHRIALDTELTDNGTFSARHIQSLAQATLRPRIGP
jgi:DNA-binding NtrC family response regulator